uniref:Uncharacterized protein n=1 Tax=Opuntia streptacantha TaxID=393608 RepID=A0A7C9DVJ3_OPUST
MKCFLCRSKENMGNLNVSWQYEDGKGRMVLSIWSLIHVKTGSPGSQEVPRRVLRLRNLLLALNWIDHQRRKGCWNCRLTKRNCHQHCLSPQSLRLSCYQLHQGTHCVCYSCHPNTKYISCTVAGRSIQGRDH